MTTKETIRDFVDRLVRVDERDLPDEINRGVHRGTLEIGSVRVRITLPGFAAADAVHVEGVLREALIRACEIRLDSLSTARVLLLESALKEEEAKLELAETATEQAEQHAAEVEQTLRAAQAELRVLETENTRLRDLIDRHDSVDT